MPIPQGTTLRCEGVGAGVQLKRHEIRGTVQFGLCYRWSSLAAYLHSAHNQEWSQGQDVRQFVSEAMVTVGKSGDSREIYCEHAGGGRGAAAH